MDLQHSATILQETEVEKYKLEAHFFLFKYLFRGWLSHNICLREAFKNVLADFVR